MLHKTSGKEAGQVWQASFAGDDFHKIMCHRQTKWRRVELCLGGLLAGTVAAIPNLTRAGLAQYNSFQGSYLSGKPAIIDRRLARQIHDLPWILSGKKRSGQVRQNHYRAS